MGPENRIVVDGLPIYFPYKTYACQIEYMTEVVKALNSKNHGALESPTGTGKTLCLLTACLAWLHNYTVKAKAGVKRIQIIYTSRTHSQLAQVKKELQKTPYRPKCVTIASRDHLCISKELRQKGLTGNALNQECRSTKESCLYYHKSRKRGMVNYINQRGGSINVPWGPLDIEDLTSLGKKQYFCPYYQQSDRVE